MKRFKKILFISRCDEQYQNSLYHAVKLAYKNAADIKFLILNKTLPKELSSYQQKLKVGYITNLEYSIDRACHEIGIKKSELHISIAMDFSDLPDMDVVRRVIKGRYDIIIKSIDEIEQGFKSFDMKLLRNTPCPIWFFRANQVSQSINKITAAVDPTRTDEKNIRLSEKIVSIANSLAKNYETSVDILCCWQPAIQETAINNAFIDITENDIEDSQQKELDALNKNLKNIISKSNIDASSNFNLHMMKGEPEAIIPGFIIDNDIEMLVMGTVNRTGVSGFFIGNTAENVLNKITCSLLALKPDGFESPVKIEEDE